MRSNTVPLGRALSLIQISFCLLFSLSPAAFAGRSDAVPDWMRAAAAQALPQFSPDTDAVILLDETVYTVAPDGHAAEHHRQVIKILRPQGRDRAMVFVPFDKDRKLSSLHVWSIAPDGHQFAMKDSEITEVGFPGQGHLYEDVRAKVAKAPGRDPGGIIGYEYLQNSLPYLTETTWEFEGDLPRVSQSFTLELPPGYTYGAVWAHHVPAAPADLEHARWRWEMKDTPAINLHEVPLRPAEDSLAGRMTVHYAGPGIPFTTEGTWKSIGQWYRTLEADRLAPSPEITAKANELTAGKTDFYDRTEAIAEFVQNQIRYFVIEMGIGGFQPHPAADIFRNRYGDCKDKATLLTAMLSSVGIHSALLMVDTERGVIDPQAPSIHGNHMVTAIEIPAGYTSPKLRSVVTASSGRKYLIFDPTWDKTAFGQLEHNLQGSYGILMEGDASQIIRLPVLSPENNRIDRSASFELNADGALKGTVTEKRFGDVSEHRRDLYISGDARQQTEFLDHALGEDFITFSVTGFQVEDAAALNKDLTTSYTLSADRFGKTMGPLLMVRPRVLGSDAPHPDRKARHVPINLSETMVARDDFNIRLPPGYAVDELPEPVKLDLGFASYESSTEVHENVLQYRRTYTVREITLPADRYPDVQKLAGVIEADEQSRAVLKKQ